MLVLRVERGCDGTGGDGAGLYCSWIERDGHGGPVVATGWVSESSVVGMEYHSGLITALHLMMNEYEAGE